jgi:tetratricopeptide (TPR) repeat protein
MKTTWTAEEVGLVAQRGYDLHLQGKNLDALTIFEGILAIEPNNLYCLDALAALWLKLGSPEKSIEYCNRLLAHDPKNADGLARRCEAFVQADRLELAAQDLGLMQQQVGASRQVERMKLRVSAAARLLKKGAI